MNRTLAGLLLLVAGVAAAQPLSRVTAFGASATGQIAFVTPEGLPARVDPVTRGVLPLADAGWPLGVRAAFPVWGPDGERIAYITRSAVDAGVEVLDLRVGTGPVRVYASRRHPPIYLSWSPQGDRLAVLASDDASLALHVADVAGGVSRLLTRGSPFYWTWDRAGDRLLVHRDVLRPGAVVGFTGLDAFEVVQPLPDPGAFQSPALSPSERLVAYAVRLAGDVRRVVVAPVTADGGERRELPHEGQAAVAWHPTRDLLAVHRSEPAGFSSLALLDAETGDLEVVVPGRSLAFFWSPDGSMIAFLTLQLAVPGVGPERLASLVPLPVSHEPSRPQLLINVLDVDTRATRAVAGFAPSALFVEQYLPFFDQYARSHRVWSPASDALVFPAVGAGGVTMVTVFGLDGTITPLTAGEMPSWNVR